MRRSLAVRAAPPLVVAIALASALAVGVQAAWAPSPSGPGGSTVNTSRLEAIASTTEGVVSVPSSLAFAELALQPLSHQGLDSLSLARLRASTTTATATSTVVSAPKASPTKKATSTAKPSSTRALPTTSGVWWSVYRGTNHVWMPTLGLSKPVYSYGCGQTTYPSNVVYRWGCGGTNNTYLFGHNFGVFYPLYQAWKTGTLRKGMPVVYADGQGHTRLYRVSTWRVVLYTDGAWAIASQPVPSMTLQTCTATSGPYRLVVRLVAAAT